VTDPKFNQFANVTKLARIPKGPGGKTWQIEVAGYGGEMGGAGYAIPVVAKRPDLSWKFIRFVADLSPYPDEKTLQYLEGGAQPTKRDVLGDPEWQKKFPLLAGLSENGPYAQFKWMQVPEFDQIAVEMSKEIGDIFTGTKSIDDGLKAMDESTYKIFERSGRYD
jgi:ABC-type glycerol-3-phosphate transport system substrate-binding protein